MVTLAAAKARFLAVVDGVRRTSRRYLTERTGRPTPAPAGALALVGAWSDVEDEAIDDFLDEILRSRMEDMGRPVGLGTCSTT